MKTAEILRKLADMIDQHSDAEVERPVNTVPHAELEPVEVDNTESGETSTMIPPLQAKLELLKKSVGEPNVYDKSEGCGCGCDPCECGGQPDELEVIKKHAGVPVIAVQELSDDEPFEG